MDSDRYLIKLPNVTRAFLGLFAVPPNDRQAISAVERFGLYFNRELHYDSPPFSANEFRYHADEIAPYLIYDDHFTIRPLGALGMFRRRATWELQWVWLHPFVRRKGVLSHVWPDLRSEYGSFTILEPHSPAMQAFLKHQETHANDRGSSSQAN